MPTTKPAIKMPELLLFAKSLTIGFAVTAVGRAAFYMGSPLAPKFLDAAFSTQVWGVIFVIVVISICFIYLLLRNAFTIGKKMVHSFRLDLLIFFIIGININKSFSPWPWPDAFDKHLNHIDFTHWTPIIFTMLFAVLLLPIIQKSCQYWPKPQKIPPQFNFVPDEEISDQYEDQLESVQKAKSFAELVLASGAHSGLVFGVDGPWGIGKTSFINLAENYWGAAKEKVIPCRFESLRYASEPDLAERLIREVSATIQRNVFAPEFRSAASKYSRLIKGKTDVSFLGFKLYLEPSKESVDELLEDIDDVLKRIGYRVIIVIDDLDRLDTKAVNNVLFATKQTFKLSQATYVLCYDTEMLAGSQEDNSRAREFLEKFVAVKLSIFIDISQIQNYLRGGWQSKRLGSNLISANTKIRIGSVLSELADIFDSDLSAAYMPLVGNLRKIKRFINAMLMTQIDKSDLSLSDFNDRDLINLMLLHLNYPGLFRKIYAEETGNRCGTFSLIYNHTEERFENKNTFQKLLEEQEDAARFLLKQLFDVTTQGFDEQHTIDEANLASRACFNHHSNRTLEKYLKLIVMSITPEPQKTYVLYQTAIEQIRKGTPIKTILNSSSFELQTKGEEVHDKFWTMLINQSYDLTNNVVEDAINTLVEYLPLYHSIPINTDRGLRQSCIYSLLQLLDNAGWGRTSGRHLSNSGENVIEIAWRIFGEKNYQGNGLLQRLANHDRGVLGWYDLMLFRLSCCADRRGQLYNLQKALIVNHDKNAATDGLVSTLTLVEMRKLSQVVFSMFKERYIDKQINFYDEVARTSSIEFLGKVGHALDKESLSLKIAITSTTIKNFVIYQLSNSLPPNGIGVGCGYYDETGKNDKHGIAKLMNKYVFDLCFNPEDDNNIHHFLDYCLSNLSSSFNDEHGFFANKAELPRGLDPKEMGIYWSQHQEQIRKYAQQIGDRHVYTYNYTASYRDDLEGVFAVLDELANDAMTAPPSDTSEN